MNDPRLIAWELSGTVIGNGWAVKNRLANPRNPDDKTTEKTGATFSVGYQVEKDGHIAFLKVFDIVSAFKPGSNLLEELNIITNGYNHEKAILNFCTTGRMSRIVKILDHGDIPVVFPIFGNPEYKLQLHYIVFERADGGDIRDLFNDMDNVTDAIRFEYLHHIAVALQQLHMESISHQDIKPSNVVIFKNNGKGAKLTDFGRALKRGMPAAHDAYYIAGDPAYAPPEQLYAHRAPDWRERREACDLFQLGSLAAFMFSGKTATAGIIEALPEDVRPQKWQGTYEDVLPIVQNAFAIFINSIKPSFPAWASTDLERIIELSCEPDVYRRGDPRARAQVGKPLGMDRFISRFNVLRTEAKRRLIIGKKIG